MSSYTFLLTSQGFKIDTSNPSNILVLKDGKEVSIPEDELCNKFGHERLIQLACDTTSESFTLTSCD